MTDNHLVSWTSPFTQSEGSEDPPGVSRTRRFVDLDSAVSFYMNLPDADRVKAKVESDGKEVSKSEINDRYERIEKERGGLPKAF